MATARRRRRGDRLRKTKKSGKGAPGGAPSVHDVPDDLLELILLRLNSSASVLRAAAACRRWRRVVTAAGFLSCFRSLHAPCVAGHYHGVDPDWADHGLPFPVFDAPTFVPSPPLTVDSRRFSLDFLPDSDSGWELADSRGGLLLLFKRRTGWGARSRCFPDLVVCEPLTRRYQGILRHEHTWHLGVFLLDGDRVDGSGGRIGIHDFKIISVLYEFHTLEDDRGMPVACVFSSGSDGGWRVLPSPSSTDGGGVSIPGAGAINSMSYVGRANGSLYWVIGEDGAMLVLDEATMDFSRLMFPADNIIWGSYDRWSLRVIGGEDGALRVVRLISNELTVFARLPGGDAWVPEKLVRLPEATRGMPGSDDGYFQRNAMIVAANETYVLVTPLEKTWLFSVEVETLRLEREHERNRFAGAAFPCELPWPPALEACSGHRRRRR